MSDPIVLYSGGEVGGENSGVMFLGCNNCFKGQAHITGGVDLPWTSKEE